MAALGILGYPLGELGKGCSSEFDCQIAFQRKCTFPLPPPHGRYGMLCFFCSTLPHQRHLGNHYIKGSQIVFLIAANYTFNVNT